MRASLLAKAAASLVLVHPLGGFCQPWPEAELLPVFGPHHDDMSRLNEEGSQILAAPL